MRLRVTLHGTLQSSAGDGRSNGAVRIELPDGASVENLLERLGIPEARRAVVISEGRVLSRGAVLRDRADVGVFQPMAGG